MGEAVEERRKTKQNTNQTNKKLKIDRGFSDLFLQDERFHSYKNFFLL